MTKFPIPDQIVVVRGECTLPPFRVSIRHGAVLLNGIKVYPRTRERIGLVRPTDRRTQEKHDLVVEIMRRYARWMEKGNQRKADSRLHTYLEDEVALGGVLARFDRRFKHAIELVYSDGDREEVLLPVTKSRSPRLKGEVRRVASELKRVISSGSIVIIGDGYRIVRHVQDDPHVLTTMIGLCKKRLQPARREAEILAALESGPRQT